MIWCWCCGIIDDVADGAADDVADGGGGGDDRDDRDDCHLSDVDDVL